MEDRTSLPSVPTSKTPGQVQDAANTTGTKSEAEAPKEHGGESLEDAVKAAIFRLRKRYRELVREEVANTVDSPEAVDEEIRYLITVISR